VSIEAQAFLCQDETTEPVDVLHEARHIEAPADDPVLALSGDAIGQDLGVGAGAPGTSFSTWPSYVACLSGTG